ncbi:MAG: hypothetical protein J6V93_00925 [Clostridia bacterium]|nr:hypothetical protein [Clostridia bacterium]
MKKRLFALFLVLVLCLSLCFGVCAAETDPAEPEEKITEVVSEEETETGKYLEVYILAGAVIGAMAIVTLLYKKKDESRYL